MICTEQNDLEIGVADDVQRREQLNEFESYIGKSELARGMQELLGAYLALERYFLEESVNKAVGMDTLDQDQQTSSMLDDVFFIVRKCVRYIIRFMIHRTVLALQYQFLCYRRAISSWSVDGVCAVVNMACGILEGEFASRLRGRLRQGYPAGYLDLAQAYNALQTSIQHGRLQASDTELARLMFLVRIRY